MKRSRVTDFVVCALGVLMVIAYAVLMYQHATVDPHSVWCDPTLTSCVTGHRP